jgi:hypothetical protein
MSSPESMGKFTPELFLALASEETAFNADASM